jgi:hypothetical protein
MRSLFTVLLLGCLSIGCDDDTTAMMQPDLSVNNDLSHPVGTQTCLQVITCASGCAGVASCQTACAAMGTAAAQMKYGALGQCAVAGCIVKNDAGVTPCSSATDTSMACQDCITAYAQSAACSTQLNACLTDK